MKTRGLSLLCCNPFEEKYMKKLAAVLAVLLLSTLLFAASYDEILSKSMANSPQMKNAELTYQNSLLTQQQNDLSDVAQVTVSTGTVSIPMTDQEMTDNGLRNSRLTLSPNLEFVLPNDGETTITATTGLGFDYGDFSSYTVTPSLGLSHKFDLTGYDSDLASSLSNARS